MGSSEMLRADRQPSVSSEGSRQGGLFLSERSAPKPAQTFAVMPHTGFDTDSTSKGTCRDRCTLRPQSISVSFHAAAAIICLSLLGACSQTPVIHAIDTLCVATSRPALTEAQRAAFRADQPLWEPLVDWLAGFIKVRDGTCLAPKAGP